MRHKLNVTHWKICLIFYTLLIIYMINCSTIPKNTESNTQAYIRNGIDGSKMEIVCILDHNIYCKEHQVGFIFNDGCRQCICKVDGAYCKTKTCVEYQKTDENPEEYCSKVVSENENNATRPNFDEKVLLEADSYEHKPGNKIADDIQLNDEKEEKGKKMISASSLTFGSFEDAFRMIPEAIAGAMEEEKAVEASNQSRNSTLNLQDKRNGGDSEENSNPALRFQSEGDRINSMLPDSFSSLFNPEVDDNGEESEGKANNTESGELFGTLEENAGSDATPSNETTENIPTDNMSKHLNTTMPPQHNEERKVNQEDASSAKIYKNGNETGGNDLDDTVDVHLYHDSDSDVQPTIKNKVVSLTDTEDKSNTSRSKRDLNNSKNNTTHESKATEDSEKSDEEKMVKNVKPLMNELNDAIDIGNIDSVVNFAEGIVDNKLSKVVMDNGDEKNTTMDNNNNNSNNSGNNATKSQHNKSKRSLEETSLVNGGKVQSSGGNSTQNSTSRKGNDSSKSSSINNLNGNSGKHSESSDWISREITVQSRTIKFPNKEAMKQMHEMFPNQGMPVLEVQQRDTHSFEDSLTGQHEPMKNPLKPVSFNSGETGVAVTVEGKGDSDYNEQVLYKLDNMMRKLIDLKHCIETIKKSCKPHKKQHRKKKHNKHQKSLKSKHLGPLKQHKSKEFKRNILSH
ncbi:unnamed protein product [Heterobilharzia americana]|nr:unnamed protein product [Heterobilharzia americana]